MKVIGMGEQKTPVAFRVACDKFIYIEVIRSASQTKQKEAAPKQEKQKSAARKTTRQKAEKESGEGEKAAQAKGSQPKEEHPAKEEHGDGRKDQKVPPEIVKLIVDSVSDIADEDGYAFMGELGNLLLKKQPDFDPRNFGFTKLTPLIRSIGRFEIDARVTDATGTKHIYLRDKEA